MGFFGFPIDLLAAAASGRAIRRPRVVAHDPREPHWKRVLKDRARRKAAKAQKRHARARRKKW